MKVISKYKDYYDFLAGSYGTDNKLVLDRTKGYVPYFSHETTADGLGKLGKDYETEFAFTLIVGFTAVDGIYYHGRFYYGIQIEQIGNVLDEQHQKYSPDKKDYYSVRLNRPYSNSKELFLIRKQPYKVPNTKEAIMYTKHTTCHKFDFEDKILKQQRYNVFPQLVKFEVNKKVFEPTAIWLALSEYLSAQITEPKMPVGNDKTRLQSHGFDAKTSFRPKIKIK